MLANSLVALDRAHLIHPVASWRGHEAAGVVVLEEWEHAVAGMPYEDAERSIQLSNVVANLGGGQGAKCECIFLLESLRSLNLAAKLPHELVVY